MNIYATGAQGYIGRALVKAGVKPLDVDVTDYNRLRASLAFAKPDIVLHLAGKSNPDWCETYLKESIRINVDGTHALTDACLPLNIPVVLFSSSYVWGGGWAEALNRHSESSPMTPARNAYGMQKSVAEFIVETASPKNKIIRLSHVFDRERCCAEMSDLQKGCAIDAPTFLYRSFIHIDHFVPLVMEYCQRYAEMPTVLHLAGASNVSYNTFWREVCRQFGFEIRLVKARRIEKDSFPAKRPHNGGLDIGLSVKLGFPQFDYIDGIKRMRDEN